MARVLINGEETDVPEEAVAYKYADPVSGERWLYDRTEAALIASLYDPALIVWVPGMEIE